MIHKTKDVELIKGNSPTEVLSNLRNGSRFGAGEELEAYIILYPQDQRVKRNEAHLYR
ncbi:hypothetical protein CLV98_12023 [Dyadobacter jejuensis]|uniref:Uncharacterized protein n=1 Tax=Dyadobacter jejuensis TaxID=1082580 RepID=A0A316AUY2_9BACT|nr:hypothetical protein [Dyadobacter jejuensis]PWJ53907.1 hypothetical protein CLV98_12023 [Dyadobacter jejuensis]